MSQFSPSPASSASLGPLVTYETFVPPPIPPHALRRPLDRWEEEDYKFNEWIRFTEATHVEPDWDAFSALDDCPSPDYREMPGYCLEYEGIRKFRLRERQSRPLFEALRHRPSPSPTPPPSFAPSQAPNISVPQKRKTSEEAGQEEGKEAFYDDHATQRGKRRKKRPERAIKTKRAMRVTKPFGPRRHATRSRPDVHISLHPLKKDQFVYDQARPMAHDELIGWDFAQFMA